VTTEGPALLLLAGGLSRRYGRPKPLEPVGPGGEALPAYTVLDALRAGFARVVLVTRPELHEALDRHLRDALGPTLPLTWVHQRLDELPQGRRVPPGRSRPWGTAHAVAVADEVLGGPFGVANADDWYGPEALASLAGFLRDHSGRHGALVGYPVASTLSDQGGVSRAQVRSSHGWVTDVEELRDVRVDSATGTTRRITGSDRSGRRVELAPDQPVSMNLWALPAGAPADLRRAFEGFLEREGNGPDAELALSDALGTLIADGLLEVQLLPEGRRWLGITFPGDRDRVAERLRELHEDGTYPTPFRAGGPGGVGGGVG
jgi:hypothetical protein